MNTIADAPNVYAGGVAYRLIVTSSDIRLFQHGYESRPFIYPSGTITAARPVSGNMNEPGIEIGFGGEGGLVVFFRDGAGSAVYERDNILRAIESLLYPAPPPPAPAPPVQAPGYYGGHEEQYGSYQEDYGVGGFEEDIGLSGKISGFLMHPADTYEDTSGGYFSDALVYLLVMASLFSVVNVLLLTVLSKSLAPENMFAGLFSTPADLVVMIITFFGYLCVATIIYGLIAYLIIRAGGWDVSPDESLSTTIYAATPYGTVGLIPLFGLIVAPFWMIYLQYTGASYGLEIDRGWAAVSAIVPAAVFFGAFYLYVIGMGGALI